MRTRVSDLLRAGAAAIGSTITLCGWARTIREQGAGSLAFIAVSDGSGPETIQVVAERGKTANFEALAACGGTGASLRVLGTVVKSPAKGQEVEVTANEIAVLGIVQDPMHYPLPKGRATLEYLREIQHLRPRTNTISAVARIRNACAYATHKFFNERGFLYVHTPIITTSDCEVRACTSAIACVVCCCVPSCFPHRLWLLISVISVVCCTLFVSSAGCNRKNSHPRSTGAPPVHLHALTSLAGRG